MFERINEYYKQVTGNDLDYGIEMELSYDEERYSDRIIYKNVTFCDAKVDRALYKLGKISYKNMLAQRKAAVL